MPAQVDKVIVTNMGVLKDKYGTGANDIKDGVKKLIAADKVRGVKTQLIDISSAAAMRRYGGKVASAASPRQNKGAVDKIYRKLTPAYIVLLGSIDVIPHQDLINQAYSGDPEGDPDRTADGDLPYACEHGYSRRTEDFLGPTRVVGRLPDLTGADDPAYVLRLLGTAAGYESRPRRDFQDYLGISAKVWKGSTQLSLKKTFGSATDLKTSPKEGPKWTAAQLKLRSHFINCHGAPADSFFYGQQGKHYPEAHDASFIDGKLSDGTVAAAECCYGAELYDPGLAGGQAGICNTYLGGGAYAFFGSSTVAYGPENGNSAADLIAQYFLKHVLSGASTGRAALQARQDYVLQHSLLDPIDLKTLAQFNLMGDPSVHPVIRERQTELVATSKAMKSLATAALSLAAGRTLRRMSLSKNGLALASAAISTLTGGKTTTIKSVRSILADALAEAQAVVVNQVSFEIGTTVSPPSTMKFLPKAVPTKAAIHFAIGRMKGDAPSPQLCAVVAREEDGAISVRRLFSR